MDIGHSLFYIIWQNNNIERMMLSARTKREEEKTEKY